jgi:hypothetical protein
MFLKTMRTCVLLGSPAAEPPDDVEMISRLMLETQLPKW